MIVNPTLTVSIFRRSQNHSHWWVPYLRPLMAKRSTETQLDVMPLVHAVLIMIMRNCCARTPYFTPTTNKANPSDANIIPKKIVDHNSCTILLLLGLEAIEAIFSPCYIHSRVCLMVYEEYEPIPTGFDS